MKLLIAVVYFYIGVEFVSALAPHMAQALANSGLDKSLQQLLEMVFSLLP